MIGNPPYDVLASEELGYDVSADLEFYESVSALAPAIRGKKNLYKLFICRGAGLMSSSGAFAFIVPMALLGDDHAAGVRRLLLENTGHYRYRSFPSKRRSSQSRLSGSKTCYDDFRDPRAVTKRTFDRAHAFWTAISTLSPPRSSRRPNKSLRLTRRIHLFRPVLSAIGTSPSGSSILITLSGSEITAMPRRGK